MKKEIELILQIGDTNKESDITKDAENIQKLCHAYSVDIEQLMNRASTRTPTSFGIFKVSGKTFNVLQLINDLHYTLLAKREGTAIYVSVLGTPKELKHSF